jgi:hypothetical protein
LLAALAALAGTTGCDRLLSVELPSRVVAGAIGDPSQASLLVTSVVGSFECAFGATTVAVGLITDELVDAQNAQAIIPYDKRDVRPEEGLFSVYASADCQGNGLGVYTPLSSARWFADDVARRLEGWTDQQVTNRQSLLATTYTYAGYSLVLLGEVMCSAAIDGGPELTPAQVLAQAEERFTKAIAAARASNNVEMLHTASVGRARARLDQGKKTDAAADADLVPEGFVKVVSAGSGSPMRENRVFIWNSRGRSVSVDERFRNLSFGGVADPRVPVTDARANGADNLTPLWLQGKYASEASPIQLATWEEAQLILAEASLGQTAVGIINRLHTKAGLPPFSSTDDAAILAQIIQERSREMFLETHRLYDMIRFRLPFTPAAGSPYPKTGVYGTTTCLPLPVRERDNNSNIGRSAS